MKWSMVSTCAASSAAAGTTDSPRLKHTAAAPKKARRCTMGCTLPSTPPAYRYGMERAPAPERRRLSGATGWRLRRSHGDNRVVRAIVRRVKRFFERERLGGRSVALQELEPGDR